MRSSEAEQPHVIQAVVPGVTLSLWQSVQFLIAVVLAVVFHEARLPVC